MDRKDPKQIDRVLSITNDLVHWLNHDVQDDRLVSLDKDVEIIIDDERFSSSFITYYRNNLKKLKTERKKDTFKLIINTLVTNGTAPFFIPTTSEDFAVLREWLKKMYNKYQGIIHSRFDYLQSNEIKGILIYNKRVNPESIKYSNFDFTNIMERLESKEKKFVLTEIKTSELIKLYLSERKSDLEKVNIELVENSPDKDIPIILMYINKKLEVVNGLDRLASNIIDGKQTIKVYEEI